MAEGVLLTGRLGLDCSVWITLSLHDLALNTNFKPTIMGELSRRERLGYSE